MARPRIVEKDYYQFQQALRIALDQFQLGLTDVVPAPPCRDSALVQRQFDGVIQELRGRNVRRFAAGNH